MFTIKKAQLALTVVLSLSLLSGLSIDKGHADVGAGPSYLMQNLCMGENAIVFFPQRETNPAFVGARVDQSSTVFGSGVTSQVIVGMGHDGACGSAYGWPPIAPSGTVSAAVIAAASADIGGRGPALSTLGVEVGVTKYALFHAASMFGGAGLNYVTFNLVGGLAAPAFTLSTSSGSATVGSSVTSYTIKSTGGAIASYSISPAIGSGLSFNTSTGLISGTPTASASAVTYTITGTNATSSATATYSLVINPDPTVAAAAQAEAARVAAAARAAAEAKAQQDHDAAVVLGTLAMAIGSLESGLSTLTLAATHQSLSATPSNSISTHQSNASAASLKTILTSARLIPVGTITSADVQNLINEDAIALCPNDSRTTYFKVARNLQSHLTVKAGRSLSLLLPSAKSVAVKASFPDLLSVQMFNNSTTKPTQSFLQGFYFKKPGRYIFDVTIDQKIVHLPITVLKA
jgi:hypothetical protein